MVKLHILKSKLCKPSLIHGEGGGEKLNSMRRQRRIYICISFLPKLEVAVISTLIIWLVAELWNLIQEDPEDGEGAEGH